ncbi:MAG TPA: ATP-binding protein [Candidatus Eisenbacteria bacterium]|nr:ATP-binding protein [Candidatus Eisenbacteria bacterium]
MRTPRSLRVQLTVTFAVFAGLVVLGTAIATSILIERTVWSPLDSRLSEEAETLAAIVKMNQNDLAPAVALIGREEDLGPGKFVRVTSADGWVVASYGPVPADLGNTGTVGPDADQRLVMDEARGTRTVVDTLPDGGSIAIGVQVEHPKATIRRARLMIAVSAALSLAILAGLAWAITTRATSELERLAAELETIEAGSLGRRLEQRNTSEVDRLAAVLNRVLARLESAIGHLRRFTADAAHELRTPIAALRTRLEVGLASSRDASAYRDDLLDALEQTERLGRLAETLLTLSAVEGDPGHARERDHTVDLGQLAREVADSFEPVAQEQGRRFALRADDHVTVVGDPDLLKRLILNLVDNAFHHTPPGANVDLAVARRNGHACIRAHDEGPGIPASEQPRVFERFYRGATAEGGAGLGLALCREIVSRHRGEILLASEPGAGTTVTVTLPLARGGEPA